jgi:hydroxylamine reductase
MSMFCYQCQETAKGTGCVVRGVCGKTDDVAQMQDLLVWVAKGISILGTIAREKHYSSAKVDRFVQEALFTTITNANFDRARIIERIHEGIALRENFITEMKGHGINIPGNLHPSTKWKPAGEQDLVDTAARVGVLATENEDVRSLRELVTYGVKGTAAYAEHAGNLGYNSDGVDGFMQRALAATTNDNLSADELVALVMETGRHGVEVMALLDKANTTSYGNPEITEVNLGVRNNPAILISGHDMKDMEELLRQTDGTGVDVYTHSEMLPANYYPAFKKYNHFVGNYGNSWWKQTTEFETFNGPVLFTTNCIVPPRESYKNRIYTTGASGYAGCTHIPDREPGKEKDFSVIIEHAKRCASPTEIETGTIVGGFAHNQVLQLADKVVEAVKSGAIRKFFVMGGCDGRMKSRDYYTEFAQKLPKDTVILTAGCAKYRYNKLKLGDINGIPRVLDAGQCNDSYSLAVIALTLKDVFGKNDINELPIAYNIAWYEQKAVIVLLALLYLGVKNIYLGPTLPGFLSPNVVNVLVDKFGITGITTPDEDMKILLN